VGSVITAFIDSLGANFMEEEELHWDQESSSFRATKPTVKAERVSGKFLKGPIPMKWLSSVAKLPGKTLHFGLAVCFLWGVQKSMKVKMEREALELLGVSRQTMYRAIINMEDAGLIVSEKRPGQYPYIEIITKGTTTSDKKIGQ
jgi:hypothetical protein